MITDIKILTIVFPVKMESVVQELKMNNEDDMHFHLHQIFDENRKLGVVARRHDINGNIEWRVNGRVCVTAGIL